MALHLAAQGVDVVGTFLSKKDEADAVVKQVEAAGARGAMLRLDAGDSASFDAFAAELSATLVKVFGRRGFDVLVNNAGIGINTPFADTTEEQFDRLVRIQLKGPYFLTQKLLPMIVDGGRILNVSSGVTRFTLPGYSAYGATKGAIEVLTRYLAKELGPRKITVNTIAPGVTETDFGGGVVRDTPELQQKLAATIALGRTGQPDDIGAAVAALLSDGCAWVNGQRIEVSGGQNV